MYLKVHNGCLVGSEVSSCYPGAKGQQVACYHGEGSPFSVYHQSISTIIHLSVVTLVEITLSVVLEAKPLTLKIVA